ncbi:hypothetical protein ABZ419_11420 [Streptomyces cinnamoneus]|uniref:hypothetical protein n=1 Tax=Streptomyces cinnamoneus TaxID=53446 RepID=UPI0034015A69
MTVLAWLWPVMMLLALLGLALCSPGAPGQYVIPVLQTTAFILTIAALGASLYR